MFFSQLLGFPSKGSDSPLSITPGLPPPLLHCARSPPLGSRVRLLPGECWREVDAFSCPLCSQNDTVSKILLCPPALSAGAVDSALCERRRKNVGTHSNKRLGTQNVLVDGLSPGNAVPCNYVSPVSIEASKWCRKGVMTGCMIHSAHRIDRLLREM